MSRSMLSSLLLFGFSLCLLGCKKDNNSQPQRSPATRNPAKRSLGRSVPGRSTPAVRSAAPQIVGVDTAKKVLYVGALNDESGPAAAIGKPFAVGKRVFFEAANANGGIAGWKVQLVEQDHGYNPSKSVQAYGKLKNKVLYIATSFGTPNTLPLLDQLTEDKMLAFPASLSSKMAEHKFTPPLATSYRLEAMRAMDWVVKRAKNPRRIRAAVVYQKDDYGQDGLEGWRAAAKHHKVKVVEEIAFSPRDRSFTSVILKLKKAKANYVLLTSLPSATTKILVSAYKQRFRPIWIGNTPSWVDAFFRNARRLKPLFRKFYLISSLPYWGEKLPGMDRFLEAYAKYGKKLNPPDFYLLASYIQGMIQGEMLRRAIQATEGKITREALLKALQSIQKFDGGGLIKPVNLAKFPYETSTQSRILKPDWGKNSWTVVADYATPASHQAK